MRDKDTAPPHNREWSFEYLRILAAFGVVWFHTGTEQFHWLGASGLYVFFLISLVLLARTPTEQPLAAFAAGKLRRLMVPWVFWALFFLLIALIRLWRHGTHFFEPWMILAGFSLHLWYLPCLFCASVALYWMRRSRPFFDTLSGVAVLAAAGLVLLVVNGMLRPQTPPLAQWMAAVPVTLLGFALGRMLLIPNAQQRRLAIAAFTACTLAACVVRMRIPAWHTEDDMMIVHGFGLFLVARCLPLPKTKAVLHFAPLTLGIYLMHPFVRDVLGKAFGESNSPLRVVMVFFACALAAHILRKIPVIRRVV